MAKNDTPKIHPHAQKMMSDTMEGPPASAAQQQEAFYYLGKLSATFANIEIQVQHFIGLLTKLGLLDYHLIEDNPLSKNLQIIKKLNKFHSFMEKEVNEFVKGMENLSEVRNNLIHGRWEIILDGKGEPIIGVWTYKIKHTSFEGNRGFARGTQHLFTFEQMRVLIKTTSAWSECLKDIIATKITEGKEPGAKEMIRKMMK